MDPGKVIVALSFFGTLIYIVRMATLAATGELRRKDAPGSGLVVDEERMARLEQAVEAIALEVERISEGQRFTTKLLAERARAGHAALAPSPEHRVS